ncbi:hypothetical protein DPMN_079564 [Dreissena polymorpha]|nr:hypothetical protein DPMN_079564 [Dreissena polymorpha]
MTRTAPTFKSTAASVYATSTYKPSKTNVVKHSGPVRKTSTTNDLALSPYAKNDPTQSKAAQQKVLVSARPIVNAGSASPLARTVLTAPKGSPTSGQISRSSSPMVCRPHSPFHEKESPLAPIDHVSTDF